MRWIVLALCFGCGGSQRAEPELGSGEMPSGSFFTEKGKPAADRRFREGPGGFPLPSDATGCKNLPNRDLTCKVPRKRDAVHDELIGYLKGRGFTVRYEGLGGQSETKGELAGGYRMHLENGAQKYLVSVTTNDAHSSLMTITVK